MILKHMIYIDEMLKLTQSQGHTVKGQGHIYTSQQKLGNIYTDAIFQNPEKNS